MTTTKDLPEMKRRHEHWEFVLTIALRFLALLVLISLGFLVYFTTATLSQVENLSRSNKLLNEQTAASAARLIDCTTPGHPCYDNGNARTATAVGLLNKATEAAVVCGDRAGTLTYAQMQACVSAELKKP